MSDKYKSPSHRPEYRRQQYVNNAEYRDRIRQNTRNRYRRDHKVYTPDAKGGLARMKAVGKIRLVRDGDKTRKILTFTVVELAALIGRTPENLQRWYGRSLLPEPALYTKHGDVHVYTFREVAVILRTLAAHFEQTAYYRYDHFDTRSAIFSAVHELRKGKDDGKKAS